MTLRGPAHPDNFRVQVGRYGERWYIDNLPACGLGEPMDEPVPSVTAVKNAWPKFLTRWAASEAATFAVDHRDAWASLPRAAAIDLISKAHERSRDASAERGTAIHEAIEALATGQGVLLDMVLPAEYQPVVYQLVEQLRPQFIVSEAVAIRQGDEGYGGTIDAIATLEGHGTFGVDWKSRKAGKGGTAYPDEFAQVAAYLGADYFIVGDGEDGAKRIPVPEVDGIAVITIDPEGYCVCVPDEHGKAVEAWTQLRRFWAVQTLDPPRSRRIAKVAGGGTTATSAPSVGSVEEPSDAAAPSSSGDGSDTGEAPDPASGSDPSPDPADAILHEARVAWVLRRVEAIREAGHLATLRRFWPDGVPTPKAVREGTGRWGEHSLTAVIRCVDLVEAEHDMPFGDPDPATAVGEPKPEPEEPPARVRVTPAEHDGSLAAPEDAKALRDHLRSLPTEVQHTVRGWLEQGRSAGAPWNMGRKATEVPAIRWRISRAAVACAEHLTGDGEDDFVRLALALVIGEQAQRADMPVGALLGALTATEADELHRIATTREPAFAADGAPLLKEAV